MKELWIFKKYSIKSFWKESLAGTGCSGSELQSKNVLKGTFPTDIVSKASEQFIIWIDRYTQKNTQYSIFSETIQI